MGVEGAVGPCTDCSLRSFLSQLWSSFLSGSFSESILLSGLRIYDVVSFLLHLEVSPSLPESESPLVFDNLCAGVTLCSPCVQDGACLCPREVSHWHCEGLISAIGSESEFVPFPPHCSWVHWCLWYKTLTTSCFLLHWMWLKKKSFCGLSDRRYYLSICTWVDCIDLISF